MANELDQLFGRSVVPCPHCGTKNEEGSETCLCCGRPLATAPGNAAPSGTEAQTNSTLATTTETLIVSDRSDAGDTADKPMRRKRLPWWAAMLLVTANALMICAVVLQVVYSKSPAHPIAEFIEDQKFVAAQVYYKNHAENNFFYRMILNRRMMARFDELHTRYENGNMKLSSYAELCRETLDAARAVGADEAVEQAVEKRFQSVLEQHYVDYLQSIVAGKEKDQREVTQAFDAVIAQDLIADPVRAQELRKMLDAIVNEGRYYTTGFSREQSANYKEAIDVYRCISSENPLASFASLAIDRCVTAWIAEVRQSLTDPTLNAATLYDRINRIDVWLETNQQGMKAFTDAQKDKLTTLRTELLPHCAAIAKQEALAAAGAAHPAYEEAFAALQFALECSPADLELAAALKKIVLGAHRDAVQDNRTILTMLHQALLRHPGDAELQAAAAPRKAQEKATLRKELPDLLKNSYDFGECVFPEIQIVKELMPEDEDVQALYQATNDEMDNHLYGDVEQGITSLFRSQGDNWNVTEDLLINPVADAFGVLHQSASLYRMTATAVAPGIFCSSYGADSGICRETLTFSVFADASCTGSGVLEVRTAQTQDASGQPVWSEPMWTATVDRTTNDLQVALDLNRAIAVEIRLTAVNGKAAILLGSASLQSVYRAVEKSA